MQRLVKVLSLVFCTVLLTTCHPKEEFEGGLFYHFFANVKSSTNSSIQVCDSIVYFNQIEGYYGCYRGEINNYFFYFALTNSLSSEDYLWNYFRIDINTKMTPPEVFFQKGYREIDSIYVNHCPPGSIGCSNLPPLWGYRANQCVFIWDSVSYDNKIFKGKGSFEIKDTLYINYPDAFYYPPQKIEFEFK